MRESSRHPWKLPFPSTASYAVLAGLGEQHYKPAPEHTQRPSLSSTGPMTVLGKILVGPLPSKHQVTILIKTLCLLWLLPQAVITS